jgi:hypothetical protein
MTETSSRVAGTSLGRHDPDIDRAVQRATRHPADPVSTWRIGVRNEEGVIYRIVTLRSLDQWLDFVEDAERLGLTDELENALELVEGFDSIFSARMPGSQP